MLDLQALDSTLDRTAHRRRTLPEIAEIEALEARLRAVRDDLVMAQTEDRDLGREQSRVEADVEQVRARAARDQQRLDTGAVASPRELENLQSEIASLARRQETLEDQVLEVMEQRESVQTRVDELTAARERLEAEIEVAERRREEAFGGLDADETAARARRDEVVGTLPGDLVSLYDKIRTSSGGVGAAALSRGRCEGCHLQLNTVDLNEIRAAPADAVLRCEECRRILVRTPESGL